MSLERPSIGKNLGKKLGRTAVGMTLLGGVAVIATACATDRSYATPPPTPTNCDGAAEHEALLATATAVATNLRAVNPAKYDEISATATVEASAQKARDTEKFDISRAERKAQGVKDPKMGWERYIIIEATATVEASTQKARDSARFDEMRSTLTTTPQAENQPIKPIGSSKTTSC